MTAEEGSEKRSVVGFKDGGRGPWNKKCGLPLEAVKGKEMDVFFPRASRKENSTADTLILANETCVGLLTHRTIR